MSTPNQRVNAAVHLAVTKILATKSDTKDAHALGQSIGKRIQGTYGAELRRLVDKDADVSTEELVAVVIAPHEHALDDALARQLRDDREAGARDRVRKRNYGTPVDMSVEIPPNLSELVAQAKAAAKVGAAMFEAKPSPPAKPVIDRENPRVVPREIYASMSRSTSPAVGAKEGV